MCQPSRRNSSAVQLLFLFSVSDVQHFSGRLGGCRVLSKITGSGRGSYLFEVAVEVRHGRGAIESVIDLGGSKSA